MLKNIFFTLVFFILDHFVLVLAASFISLLAMKYCYRIWQDQNAGLGYEIYFSNHIVITVNSAFNFYCRGCLYYCHHHSIFP